MTPKEKANELIDKMYYVGRYDDKEDYNPAMAWERAKQCALIVIEEKISTLSVLPYEIEYLSNVDYYEGLKQEIKNL